MDGGARELGPFPARVFPGHLMSLSPNRTLALTLSLGMGSPGLSPAGSDTDHGPTAPCGPHVGVFSPPFSPSFSTSCIWDRRRSFGASGPTCAPLGAALLSPRAWGLTCIELGASSPRGAPALLPWSISIQPPAPPVMHLPQPPVPHTYEPHTCLTWPVLWPCLVPRPTPHSPPATHLSLGSSNIPRPSCLCAWQIPETGQEQVFMGLAPHFIQNSEWALLREASLTQPNTAPIPCSLTGL